MDILSIYWPNDDEVPDDRVLAIRADLAARTRKAWPSTDTSPNSVFGDTYLSPAAFNIACCEIAWGRLLSDLDPENAAAGTVYSCDFVEAFLKNFGLYNAADNRSTGILRLVFSDNLEREIDRSTQFRIGDMTYRMVLPHEGPLTLLAAGVAGNVGENFRNYAPYTVSSWVVDVLVQGNPGTSAEAGATVEVDREVDGLVAVTALSDFSTGYPPDRIQDLARRTRHNFHSRTPNTRTGAVNYINQRFPDIVTTGCLVSGDPELARDVANTGQVAAGKMDVLVRADEPLPDSSTQYVRYITTGNDGGTPVRKFVGLVHLPETAIEFTAVTHAGVPVEAVFHSVTADPAAFPGLTASYGSRELFLVEFDMPYDGDQPLVNLVTGTEGDETVFKAAFRFDYLFDPHLKMVQDILGEGDDVPVGLDSYVRYFTPVKVHGLEVTFNRKSGVQLNLSQARQEILQSFNRHSFDNPATAASIADSFAYAGAHSVVKMEIHGTVRFSPATMMWAGDTFELPVDEATYEAYMADTVPVPVHTVTSIYEPGFDFIDTEDGTFAASGPRSVTWMLSTADLTFVENRSV